MPHYDASSRLSSSKLATYAKRVMQSSQLHVQIKFDADNEGSSTYTTGSTITGSVAITALQTTPLDEVQITLEGRSRVEFEQMSPMTGQARIRANHSFLKLQMPIPESRYPQPRIAEEGETYIFPFHFVVPHQLLPSACTHACIGDHVRHAHMKLPPSLGDLEVSPASDLAPVMSKVVYSINAKVVETSEGNSKAQLLAHAIRKLHIIPAVVDDPPMHVDLNDTEYALSRMKTIKKGIFKGKRGSVTLSSTQPKSFVVSPFSTASPPSTTVILNLRFDPSEPSAAPPRISSITTRIKSSTFCSAKAQPDFARRNQMTSSYEATRCVFSSSYTLGNLTLDSTNAWSFKNGLPEVPPYSRRDSGYESGDEPPCPSDVMGETAPSDAQSGGHWKAQLHVPISLPHDVKMIWLPSFHSCIISRIYYLDVTVFVSTGSTNSSSTALHLRLPVQISCSSAQRRGGAVHIEPPVSSIPLGLTPPQAGGAEPPDFATSQQQHDSIFGVFRGFEANSSSSETARVEEVDGFSTPRGLGDLGAEYSQSSEHASLPQDAPPDYEAFVGSARLQYATIYTPLPSAGRSTMMAHLGPIGMR